MLRRSFLLISLLCGLKPRFSVSDRVLCYGKRGLIERVETSKKAIYHTHLIHAAMFGDIVTKEPFYLVRFEQPEQEIELFKGFDPEYLEYLKPFKREFKTILAPQRAISEFQ